MPDVDAFSWGRLLERSVTGKHPDRPCEDRVVTTPVLVAVLDGVTTKDRREWDLAGRTATSGEWAVATLAAALGQVGPEWEAERAVDHLSRALADRARELHPDVPTAHHPAASMVLVHGPRRELWAVGDCQWLVDGERGENRKRIDALTAELRAAVHAAVAAGVELPGRDPGRELILPFLEIQGALSGTSGEFGFGQLDGTRVLPEHLVVVPLPAGAHVVLATDGYPDLRDDLETTEKVLRAALADDPQCLGPVLRGTKGLAAGQVSYDDRAYVSLRLTGEAFHR